MDDQSRMQLPGILQEQTILQIPAISHHQSYSWFLRPSVFVILVYLLLLGFFTIVSHDRAIDFVHLGTVWSEHDKSGTWGYDGQFYYQIARDPLGAAQFMDNAPYRYQHCLYALAAWALSFGQTAFIPYTLLLLNLFSIIGSVEIFSHLLRQHGFSPWFSLALGLYFGQAIGLTFDTTEPFTCFLISIGIWFFEEKRITLSAFWMGLAIISRETAVFFPLCITASFVWQHQWRNAIRFLALGILPEALFLLLLARIFGQTGMTFTPPAEHMPFAGIFYYWQAPHKFWLLILMIVFPLLSSLGFLSWDLLHRRISTTTLIWASNLALIIFMSHFSYIELISAGRLSIATVLAGILYALKTRNTILLWSLQFYALTFLVYLLGTAFHLASFLA